MAPKTSFNIKKAPPDDSEEYFDELEFSSFGSNKMKKFGSFITNKTELFLILSGLALLSLILIFVLFNPTSQMNHDGSQIKSIQDKLKKIETENEHIKTILANSKQAGAYDRLIKENISRLIQIENRLKEIEGTYQRFTLIEEKSKKIDTVNEEYQKLKTAVLQKLDQLDKKIDTIHQKNLSAQGPSVSNHTKTAKVSQKKATKKYHQIRPGETLFSISRRYDISVKDLCRLNNFTQEEEIYPGQKLLIK